jgi:hypothetical protein
MVCFGSWRDVDVGIGVQILPVGGENGLVYTHSLLAVVEVCYRPTFQHCLEFYQDFNHVDG